MADVDNAAPAATDATAAAAPAQGTGQEAGGNTLLTGTAAPPAAPAADASANAPAAPAQPEAYELTAPEGYPADGLPALNKLCRDNGLTKAQGEAVLKYLHTNYTAWQESQAAQVKKWGEEIRADKDFGGDKFEANVADARRGLATFDEDGSIRAMLEATGYGNHPAVLKIFARVGKALGEDKLHGGGGQGANDKPLEARMWPDMQ